MTATNVQVSYQAPDRFTQIEHGQETSADGTTIAATITKIYIGGSYFEADTTDGQAPAFAASTRCPGSNVAEYVLAILREIAKTKTTKLPGGRYAFQIPKGSDVPFPISGTATVKSGYVDQLSVSPDPRSPLTIRIGSINAAPPIDAPPTYSENHVTCH